MLYWFLFFIYLGIGFFFGAASLIIELYLARYADWFPDSLVKILNEIWFNILTIFLWPLTMPIWVGSLITVYLKYGNGEMHLGALMDKVFGKKEK